MLLVFVIGFAMMVQMASTNTLLQTITDEDKRGRVMSFYMMAFMGTTPLGSLLAGQLAARIDTPNTLRVGGLCVAAGGIWFATRLASIRVLVRPIYHKLGILAAPPVPVEGPLEPPVPLQTREPQMHADEHR